MHTNASRVAALMIGFSAAAALSAGCGSRASAVCSLICECEHCNDYEESISCTLYETQVDVADAYGCAEQWDAWAACVEQRGTCDATEARFTTSKVGSCSSFQSINVPCMTQADCDNIDNDLSCEAGMCSERVCSGGGGNCNNDGDCQGEDLCDAEEDALELCIDNASAHGGTSIEFD